MASSGLRTPAGLSHEVSGRSLVAPPNSLIGQEELLAAAVAPPASVAAQRASPRECAASASQQGRSAASSASSLQALTAGRSSGMFLVRDASEVFGGSGGDEDSNECSCEARDGGPSWGPCSPRQDSKGGSLAARAPRHVVSRPGSMENLALAVPASPRSRSEGLGSGSRLASGRGAAGTRAAPQQSTGSNRGSDNIVRGSGCAMSLGDSADEDAALLEQMSLALGQLAQATQRVRRASSTTGYTNSLAPSTSGARGGAPAARHSMVGAMPSGQSEAQLADSSRSGGKLTLRQDSQAHAGPQLGYSTQPAASGPSMQPKGFMGWLRGLTKQHKPVLPPGVGGSSSVGSDVKSTPRGPRAPLQILVVASEAVTDASILESMNQEGCDPGAAPKGATLFHEQAPPSPGTQPAVEACALAVPVEAPESAQQQLLLEAEAGSALGSGDEVHIDAPSTTDRQLQVAAVDAGIAASGSTEQATGSSAQARQPPAAAPTLAEITSTTGRLVVPQPPSTPATMTGAVGPRTRLKAAPTHLTILQRQEGDGRTSSSTGSSGEPARESGAGSTTLLGPASMGQSQQPQSPSSPSSTQNPSRLSWSSSGSATRREPPPSLAPSLFAEMLKRQRSEGKGLQST